MNFNFKAYHGIIDDCGDIFTQVRFQINALDQLYNSLTVWQTVRSLGQSIWKYKSLYQVNAFFIFWGWQLMGFSAFMYIYVNITEQCAQVSLLIFTNSFQIDAPSVGSYWLSAGLIWLAESIWNQHKQDHERQTKILTSVPETKWRNNRFRKVSFWRYANTLSPLVSVEHPDTKIS